MTRPGPLAQSPLSFLTALAPLGERLYLRELAKRNARFDAGVGVVTLDRPVISVGNLSTGGTGKTPMVRWVVEQLLATGHHPAIAMRGYGSRRGELSDEQDEYRRAFDRVPIVAQPNRTDGLIALFHTAEGEAVETVVLDDGFQHRRLARALDIVLVDLSAGTLDDRCLPAGHNREPVENLARADAIVLTHAERVDEQTITDHARRIERLTGRPPTAVTEHAWHGFDGASGELPTRVHAVCAIGHPEAFLAHARGHFEVTGQTVLRDHDRFDAGVVRALRDKAAHAGALLCTNKDWSKLRHHGWPVPVVRPRLSHAFRSGEHELLRLVVEATGAQDELESSHE